MTACVNLAKGLSYWLSQSAHETYPDTGKGLTDGVIGTAVCSDRAWQGHLRDEFRAITFDLGAPRPIAQVDIGFLHEKSAGIFLPDRVLLYTSVDGAAWGQPLERRRSEYGARASSPARQQLSFARLNRTARYVRIVFFCEVWVFIDEVEIWGEERIVAVEGPTDRLAMDDPCLGLAERAAASWRPDRLPEETVGAYFPPGSPEAAGVKHLMLVYTHKEWTLDAALPYVAYAPRPAGGRLAPDRWTDWFFDAFLFLALVTPARSHAFDSASRATPARWEHWRWFVDYLFQPGQQLDAFEQAVARAKTDIDDSEYKAKVVIMIPYPIPSVADFGDPYGTGESLSFTRFDQGVQNQLDARLGAVQAYLRELDRRWQERRYAHLEWVGLYWLAELIEGEADIALLHQVSKLVEKRGQKLFWIPYFGATGWAQWKAAGIDAAIYQPNYMFNTSVPPSRLTEAAKRARRYGMGLEIEADGTVLSSGSGRERYLAYLKGGVECGFMTEALHGYYQGVDLLSQAFSSPDAEVRAIYEATYEYVKGGYKPDDGRVLPFDPGITGPYGRPDTR